VLTLTPFYPHRTDEADGSFVAEPLAHLSEFNIRSTVIVARPISRSNFEASQFAPANILVRYPQLPGRAAYGSWGLMIYARIFRLVARLHREQPVDVIHTHAALPGGQSAAMIARRLKIPFVNTTHGLDAFSTRREKGLSRWWCDRVSRYVYKSARQNICVSRAVSREIVKVLGESVKTTIVYNGVDTEMFAPSREIDNGPRATILSVGRLVPDKGQDLVLRAIAILREKHPAISYEVIGDGPDEARLAALAQELGIRERVIFPGRTNRQGVADAMKRCSVFALPSSDEALGCVYLEAMATAKPVIACRDQGIEEIIRDGENGLLIEPDNVGQLAGALDTLLKDASARERIGERARKTTLEGLTLTDQARHLNEVYRECIARYAEANRR
jgi:glycosyltransferase involved in cell wall biosynthesis